MTDTKPWYASLTIWGAIVSVLASVLSLFEVRLDPQLQSDLRDWLLAAATLAGGAAALWGRLRASRRILSPRTTETRPRDWRMNAALPFAPISLFFLLSQCTGCSMLQAPAADYIAADRATYDAVAPEYAAYVDADAAIDDDGRARRTRTLASWDARIRAARGSQPQVRSTAPFPNRKSEIRSTKSGTNLNDRSGNVPNGVAPSPF